MKKVLSVLACGVLAACACDENQWEEVDVVDYDEPVYIEQAPQAEPAPAPVLAPAPVVKQETVYIQAPLPQPTAPVYNCPCAAVQPMPCYQAAPCYQPAPCGCQQVQQPAPKPKVTTTKKIITTTTTTTEPCGKPVCEPVVTTHEEIIPAEVSYEETTAPEMVEAQEQPENLVEVTVAKNPYRSEVVGMRALDSQADAAVAAKYKPEAYDVVASRATNRMLQDTAAIYDNGAKKHVYLKETRLLDSDLPYGSQRLKTTTKDIISGSRTYDVVNNAENADFVIETSADWYVAANKNVPALRYKMTMLDKSGKKVNEWVEIIRQIEG